VSASGVSSLIAQRDFMKQNQAANIRKKHQAKRGVSSLIVQRDFSQKSRDERIRRFFTDCTARFYEAKSSRKHKEETPSKAWCFFSDCSTRLFTEKSR